MTLHILTIEGAYSLEVLKQKLIRKDKFFFFNVFVFNFIFIFICPTARKVPSLALFVPSDGGEILPLHCLNKKVQEDKMSALSCLQMSHHNPEQRLQPKFGSHCHFFRLHSKSSLILNTYFSKFLKSWYSYSINEENRREQKKTEKYFLASLGMLINHLISYSQIK